jgi:hypothetical protein
MAEGIETELREASGLGAGVTCTGSVPLTTVHPSLQGVKSFESGVLTPAFEMGVSMAIRAVGSTLSGVLGFVWPGERCFNTMRTGVCLLAVELIVCAYQNDDVVLYMSSRKRATKHNRR